MNHKNSNLQIDQKIFIPSILITIIVAAPLIYYAESLQDFLKSFYHFLTVSFGWAYTLVFLGGVLIALLVAFSPYGKIRLGGEDAKPKFSNFAWISMLIASGYGIGIVNWSMVEPINTLILSPMGEGANPAYPLEVAATYGIFHWGLFYWGVYLLPCVPIFYFLGIRMVNRQRVSECLTPLWGEKNTKGLLGSLFDIFMVIALVGGIGVTLGTAIPLVSGMLAPQLGITDSRTLQIIILFVFVGITGVSVFGHVSKGMKFLSDVNSYLTIIALLIVLIGGPTAYILNLGTNSIGLLIDLLPRISTWTDPMQTSSFPANWTIFYGAWILAYGPMMGIFITSISIGRTLKEVILNCILWGNVAAFLFFSVMGGFALYLQYTGVIDIYNFYLQNGVGATVHYVLTYAPLSAVIKPIYCIIAMVFLATTIDSAIRVLSSMTMKEKFADEESSSFSKIAWTVVLALLVFGIIMVGGMEIIQSLAVGATIPLVFICVLMVIAMYKSFKQDYPDIN